MLSMFTVGTTIQTLATFAVYPPSRPIIPVILAPIFCAYFNASTIFGLIFFYKSPPPTEKIKSISVDFNLLVFNHSEKTVDHPSSLVRAVSSDTLSVGA